MPGFSHRPHLHHDYGKGTKSMTSPILMATILIPRTEQNGTEGQDLTLDLSTGEPS